MRLPDASIWDCIVLLLFFANVAKDKMTEDKTIIN